MKKVASTITGAKRKAGQTTALPLVRVTPSSRFAPAARRAIGCGGGSALEAAP